MVLDYEAFEQALTLALDSFISEFPDAYYPRLTYPAMLPSQDELIVIRGPGQRLE